MAGCVKASGRQGRRRDEEPGSAKEVQAGEGWMQVGTSPRCLDTPGSHTARGESGFGRGAEECQRPGCEGREGNVRGVRRKRGQCGMKLDGGDMKRRGKL